MKKNTVVSPGSWREVLYLAPALVFSSLCLLIPAFYNHYPLLNPDTGTYIGSGFSLQSPIDRPIVYGLWVRVFCMHRLSLWCVVFCQALAASWLIYRIMRNIVGNGKYILTGMAVVGFLAVCSSLSWLVSQVQPDMFTAIAFLCIVVILFNKEKKMINILVYALFLIAVAVHLSHPALMVGSLVVLWILKPIYAPGKKLTKQFLILILLSVGSIALMVRPMFGARQAFFIGSLLQKGVLKTYLDDNCRVKNYELCKYKDELPTDANEFWWASNSPFNKMGGWDGSRADYGKIIHDLLTTPKYAWMYVCATAKQAKDQAINIQIGDGNEPISDKQPAFYVVQAFFNSELPAFKSDRQNTSYLIKDLENPNRFLAAIVILSLLGFAFILLKWRTLSAEMKLLLVATVTGVVLNCLDCAAFGIVNGRYGCKMIWLLPFCVIAYMVGRSRQAEKI